MNCNDVKERLVDFLYEDMPTDVRAAFEEHLRGCPACKTNVASYRRTLANTRAALAGSLAQEPPVRIRKAVMEAATAAASRKASPAGAFAGKQTTLGFFARLWRAPWLLPAVGAASVATVVFLVRVLKNPEVLPGQRPQSNQELTEWPTAASSPIAAPAQGPEKTAPAAADDTEAKAASPAQPRDGNSGGKLHGEVRGKLALPKAQALARGPLRASDLGGFAPSSSGAVRADKQSPPEPAHAKKKLDRDALSGDGEGFREMVKPGFAEPPPPRPLPGTGAEASGKPSRHEDTKLGRARALHVDDLREEARPHERERPPAPTALAPATPASAESEAPQPNPSRARRSGPAAAAPAAPSPVASAKPGPAKNVEAAPSAADRALDEEGSDGSLAKRQTGPSLADSLRRADRLFADQSWSAAADAYRDLLRRFPAHKDAGKWRARMDQSLVAQRAARQPPPAKASRTIDDAKGSRQ